MNSAAQETLLAKYENKAVRALVQLIPFGAGGALDVYLMSKLDDIRRDRSEAFFDELAKGGDRVDRTTHLE